MLGIMLLLFLMNVNDLHNKTIELLNPWWSDRSIDLGIQRDIYLEKISDTVDNKKQILFLLGSRRVGKTIIMFQYIYQLIQKGVMPKKILFMSLDNINLQDLNLFSYLSESNFEYVLLDEVHYFTNWAQILKSLDDLPLFKSKIICSGSSSKLIEDNKAFLTGRNVTIQINPLSFIESKQFNNSEDEINDYLYYGGYPEYVLEKQPNYLNDLLRDVLEKDILKLHNIRNSRYLFDICQILAKQVGSLSSSNKISKILNIDNKTVVNYINYLREVRLIDQVYQYSDSVNKKLYAPKKYYFNDLGMRNSFVGFSDIGALVENAIFLKLSVVYGSDKIYYFSNDREGEIDFVVSIDNSRILLLESKYKNLEQSVINSLNSQFFKDIYNKEIVGRFVITDGINSQYENKGVNIQMISLKDFLEKNNKNGRDFLEMLSQYNVKGGKTLSGDIDKIAYKYVE